MRLCMLFFVEFFRKRMFVLAFLFSLLYNVNIESRWDYGDTKVSRKNF